MIKFVLACLASLAVATSVDAAAILQVQQQDNTQTPIVFSASGSTTTVSTTGTGATGLTPPGWVPVLVKIGAAPIAQPAFMSFTSALTSSAVATTTNGQINQGGYSGTIQFNFTSTPATLTNILTVTFTNGTFSGAVGGNSVALTAAQPPNSVTYVSNTNPELVAGLNQRDFSLSFSGLTSPLALTGSTIGNNSASVTGTFSGSVVPEPASVVMMSISAIAGLGYYGFRRRFMA
jgi:hypothetical protein